MSTPWASAASKLASVLPGSMWAAPLWPTRRGPRARGGSSPAGGADDGSLIAVTMPEAPATRRARRRLASAARPLQRDDGAARAELRREHDERKLVDDASQPREALRGHAARE